MNAKRRVTVIGGGPGGYVAAIRAAQLGAVVTLVEDKEVGGTCLNHGCIPSKALLFNVEVADLLKKGDRFGIRGSFEPGLDLKKILERKKRIVETQVRGVRSLLKSWGVSLLEGRGKLAGKGRVEVNRRDGSSDKHDADRIILATGSKPIQPGIFPFDGSHVITSEEALAPEDIPGRLLIVGAGVEGCEFAFLYKGLGSEVKLVEMQPRVLATEDEDVSALILREMKKKKIAVHLETRVEKVILQGGKVDVTLNDGRSGGGSETVNRVLVSIGRVGNTGGIGLEDNGVNLGKKGEIEVNEKMETSVPGIYAIGDAVGRVMLAHVASAEGKVAAANAAGAGPERLMDYGVVPAGIFTQPEIGTVGLKEWEAEEKGIKIKIGRFPMRALGRVHAMDELAGFVKVICDAETDKILGVHCAGPHTADLVHEAALAIRLGAKAGDLAEMIHAHPTMAEGLMEAAEDVSGEAIHQPPKKEMKKNP